jgi:hypothetical protein
MIRSASLLCAGIIIILTSFTSAPAQTPPPPPVAVCNAATFLGNVQVLSTPFAPSPGAPAPQGAPLSPNSPYTQGLFNAFNTAAPAFQQQLCNLDRVYINQAICANPDNCPVPGDSWGWAQSRPNVGKGHIVALSAGLWSYASHPTPYADYETDLLQTMLPLPGANYSAANVDNFSLVLLSALAHEMGHILWYVAVTPYPHGQPAPDPKDFCNGTFFPVSWSLVTAPPQWRVELTPAQRYRLWGRTNWPNLHRFAPHVRDIDNSGILPYRQQQIYGLFAANQAWPSAFGTVSPDEDFVETYRFKILTSELTTPVTSVTITIPMSQAPPGIANVAADYARGLKPDLAAKVRCIPDLF